MKVFRGGGLELHFVEATFAAERILIRDDTSRLNWAKGKSFALPSGNNFLLEEDFSSPACFRAKFLYFSDITATVTVDEYNGAVRFSYLFRNEGKDKVAVEEGDLGVYFPFNDAFDIPSVTLRRRVHSFIHTEGATYISNVRVSGEPNAVSLIMTKGECTSYRTELHVFSVDKGDVSLDVPSMTLEPNATYEWEFLLFSHRDEAEFYDKARAFGFFLAEADTLVVRTGESIVIRSDMATELIVGEKHILFTDGACSFVPEGVGEKVASITDGVNVRNVRYYVLPEDIKARRIEHLSHLREQGAFKGYDASSGRPLVQKKLTETTAMPLLFLMSEVLLGRKDVASMADAALEYYDRSQCFAGVVARGDAMEAAVFSAVKYEEYWCRRDVVCLMESAAAISALYKEKAVCAFTPAYRVILALRREGKETVADELSERLVAAADAVIAGGNKYDEKELYSPFAVCAALFLLSDAFLLTGKEYYSMNAKEHLARACSFFSVSCDYRTNALPILLSEDESLGLTYEMSPNIDAVPFALAFAEYACACGDKEYERMARNILTSLLTLFRSDGSARRGLPLPVSVNEVKASNDFSWEEDVILYLINLLFERE